MFVVEERAQFCSCVESKADESAIIDLTEYGLCDKCSLPIESTGVPVEDAP